VGSSWSLQCSAALGDPRSASDVPSMPRSRGGGGGVCDSQRLLDCRIRKYCPRWRRSNLPSLRGRRRWASGGDRASPPQRRSARTIAQRAGLARPLGRGVLRQFPCRTHMDDPLRRLVQPEALVLPGQRDDHEAEPDDQGRDQRDLDDDQRTLEPHPRRRDRLAIDMS
jgi:hypothetical protein